MTWVAFGCGRPEGRDVKMLLEGRLEAIAVSSPGLCDCGNVVCARV